MFPAISALVATYGLVSNPFTVPRQLALLSDLLPPPAYELIHDRVLQLVRQPHGKLSWHLIVGILLALWSAATGTKSMQSALNVVYEVEETRGILHFQATGLGLTGLAVVGAVLAISGMVLLPAVLSFVGLSRSGAAVIHTASLLLLVALFAATVALLYRVGPSRDRPARPRPLPGAAPRPGCGCSPQGRCPTSFRSCRDSARPTDRSAPSSVSCCGSTSRPMRPCWARN